MDSRGVMGDEKTFEDCAHCGWPVVIQRYYLNPKDPAGEVAIAEAECGGCCYTIRLEGKPPQAEKLLTLWNEHMQMVRYTHAEPSSN